MVQWMNGLKVIAKRVWRNLNKTEIVGKLARIYFEKELKLQHLQKFLPKRLPNVLRMFNCDGCLEILLRWNSEKCP